MDRMTCRDFPALRTVLTEPWKYCLTKVLSRSPGLDCIRCDYEKVELGMLRPTKQLLSA